MRESIYATPAAAGHLPLPPPYGGGRGVRGWGDRGHTHRSSTQVSLVPPPWLEFTTSEPCFSATRVSPPGTMRTRSRPRQHERPQIDVARRDAGLDAGRAGRERERRLGDEALGIELELGAERSDLRLVGHRPDQHAVAAGAVHLLDHQLLEMVEHIAQMLGLAAAPGRHVLQDRLFAEIEFQDRPACSCRSPCRRRCRCRPRWTSVTLPA